MLLEQIACSICFVCFVAGAIGLGYKTLKIVRVSIAESKKLITQHKRKLENLQKKHTETMELNEMLIFARTAVLFPIIKRTIGTDCEDLVEEDLEAGHSRDFSTSETQTENNSLPTIGGSCSFNKVPDHVIIPVTD